MDGAFWRRYSIVAGHFETILARQRERDRRMREINNAK